MRKWVKIETEKDLPPEGKYVWARHNKDNHFDSDDQYGVNFVVVKLVKGISKAQRNTLSILRITKTVRQFVDTSITPTGCCIKHSLACNLYSGCDEWGNNEKPYNWESFGPSSYFGQEITHWMEIPKVEE